MIKKYWVIPYTAFCLYIGAGLFAGLLMQRAIPALNIIGVAYIGATWPAQIYCARKYKGDANCVAIPSPKTSKYMFTFS